MEEAAAAGAGHVGGEQERASSSAAEVYCAVGKDAGKEWRANLRWVLANFPARSRSQRHRLVLVLAHVHRPPRLINMMGAWVPASHVADREVAAYRKLEEDKASRALDDLLRICKTQRVHARKVLVAGDDAAAGLLQLVEDNGVAELVMGAAADRAYTRKMRAPRSKKAAKVQRKASPSCRIWFVCKGNLVCMREASEGQSSAEPSTSTGSTSPRPSASEHSTSKSPPPRLLPPWQGDDPTTSLRRAPPSRDGSKNATDDGAEHSGHGAAAVVAEARPPTAFQPEPEGGEETEERLAVEQDQRELDNTREVDGGSFEPEIQVAGSACTIDELDVRMPEPCNVVDALQREQPAADNSVQEPMAVAVGGGDQGVSFVRFRLSELEEATNSFDDSARISGGGNGRGGVYRGTLRGMSVAVKIISPDVTEATFARAAGAMARARHPGLVPLVGACPEARALVHELVPGGSLEDRLAAVPGAAPPLPWHARCGVAYETCAALAYLHSTGTVHGGVRAANILFEDDERRSSSSKLAGLGTSTLAAPKRAGRVALAYVDPRYRATGELTPQCDVHALGVVLLRLVTGKTASAAKKAAREAATGAGAGRGWHEVADASAGGWPTECAREVAILGLKCCYVSDGRVSPRPAAELLEEARCVLEAVTSAAPGRTWSSLASSSAGHPCLASSDRSSRFGHEGVAGERARRVADDQPQAPADELIVPNHALRAAIREWRHTSLPS